MGESDENAPEGTEQEGSQTEDPGISREQRGGSDDLRSNQQLQKSEDLVQNKTIELGLAQDTQKVNKQEKGGPEENVPAGDLLQKTEANRTFTQDCEELAENEELEQETVANVIALQKVERPLENSLVPARGTIQHENDEKTKHQECAVFAEDEQVEQEGNDSVQQKTESSEKVLFNPVQNPIKTTEHDENDAAQQECDRIAENSHLEANTANSETPTKLSILSPKSYQSCEVSKGNVKIREEQEIVPQQVSVVPEEVSETQAESAISEEAASARAQELLKIMGNFFNQQPQTNEQQMQNLHQENTQNFDNLEDSLQTAAHDENDTVQQECDRIVENSHLEAMHQKCEPTKLSDQSWEVSESIVKVKAEQVIQQGSVASEEVSETQAEPGIRERPASASAKQRVKMIANCFNQKRQINREQVKISRQENTHSFGNLEEIKPRELGKTATSGESEDTQNVSPRDLEENVTECRSASQDGLLARFQESKEGTSGHCLATKEGGNLKYGAISLVRVYDRDPGRPQPSKSYATFHRTDKNDAFACLQKPEVHTYGLSRKSEDAPMRPENIKDYVTFLPRESDDATTRPQNPNGHESVISSMSNNSILSSTPWKDYVTTRPADQKLNARMPPRPLQEDLEQPTDVFLRCRPFNDAGPIQKKPTRVFWPLGFHETVVNAIAQRKVERSLENSLVPTRGTIQQENDKRTKHQECVVFAEDEQLEQEGNVSVQQKTESSEKVLFNPVQNPIKTTEHDGNDAAQQECDRSAENSHLEANAANSETPTKLPISSPKSYQSCEVSKGNVKIKEQEIVPQQVSVVLEEVSETQAESAISKEATSVRAQELLKIMGNFFNQQPQTNEQQTQNLHQENTHSFGNLEEIKLRELGKTATSGESEDKQNVCPRDLEENVTECRSESRDGLLARSQKSKEDTSRHRLTTEGGNLKNGATSFVRVYDGDPGRPQPSKGYVAFHRIEPYDAFVCLQKPEVHTFGLSRKSEDAPMRPQPIKDYVTFLPRESDDATASPQNPKSHESFISSRSNNSILSSSPWKDYVTTLPADQTLNARMPPRPLQEDLEQPTHIFMRYQPFLEAGPIQKKPTHVFWPLGFPHTASSPASEEPRRVPLGTRHMELQVSPPPFPSRTRRHRSRILQCPRLFPAPDDHDLPLMPIVSNAEQIDEPRVQRNGGSLVAQLLLLLTGIRDSMQRFRECHILPERQAFFSHLNTRCIKWFCALLLCVFLAAALYFITVFAVSKFHAGDSNFTSRYHLHDNVTAFMANFDDNVTDFNFGGTAPVNGFRSGVNSPMNDFRLGVTTPVNDFRFGVTTSVNDFRFGVTTPVNDFDLDVTYPVSDFHSGVTSVNNFHSGVTSVNNFHSGVTSVNDFHSGVTSVNNFDFGVTSSVNDFHSGVTCLVNDFRSGVTTPVNDFRFGVTTPVADFFFNITTPMRDR